MKPHIYWPARPRWVPVLQVGVTLLCIVQAWAWSMVDYDVPLPTWYFIMLALTATWQGASDLHVAHAGVLVVPDGWVGFRYVPMAVAEVKERPADWYIRWPEGRLWRSVRLRRSPAIDALVRSAAADGARRAVVAVGRTDDPMEWKMGLLLVAAALLALPAMWLDLPALTLVWAGIPWLLHKAARAVARVLLTPEGLWLIRREGSPLFIDRETARAAEAGSRGGNFARFPLPDGSSVSLNRYRNADFLRLLRQPPAPADTTAEVPSAASPAAGSQTVRCSLCGTPVEAPTGTVAVCDPCQARTRLEAVEGGHGPRAQERKPM